MSTVENEIIPELKRLSKDERVTLVFDREGWVMEVRRLCDNGHQTSVISTRQDLSMEEIARRMFFRWNQENYFKYMRDEHGCDHLVSRDVEQADVERMVPNPHKKKRVQECLKQERLLKNKKEKYATKAVDNDEKKCRTMRGFNISNCGLKTEIQLLEEKIETLMHRPANCRRTR